MLKRLHLLFALTIIGGAFTSPTFAECGGKQQCIAVSIDPAVAPVHGTARTSATLEFADQETGSFSAAKTILVAAVTGTAGALTTLDAITLGGLTQRILDWQGALVP